MRARWLSATALQDQRVQRHDEQSAEDADQCAIERHAPAARGEETASTDDCGGAGRVRVRMREIQAEQAHRHADRSERHQADLHLVARQPFAGQRSQRRADGKRREQQRVHRLVAAEHVAARRPGSCARISAPTSQNQEMPNNDRKMARVCAAKRITCQVEVIGLKLTLRVGIGGLGARDEARADRYVTTATDDHGHGRRRCSRRRWCRRRLRRRSVGRQQPARDRADENGDEGAGIHQRVAADQLALAQVLRHQRILERAEDGGQHA